MGKWAPVPGSLVVALVLLGAFGPSWVAVWCWVGAAVVLAVWLVVAFQARKAARS